MGVFDAEFLTILITTFVISHIDPVVKLLHCLLRGLTIYLPPSNTVCEDALKPIPKKCEDKDEYVQREIRDVPHKVNALLEMGKRDIDKFYLDKLEYRDYFWCILFLLGTSVVTVAVVAVRSFVFGYASSHLYFYPLLLLFLFCFICLYTLVQNGEKNEASMAQLLFYYIFSLIFCLCLLSVSSRLLDADLLSSWRYLEDHFSSVLAHMGVHFHFSLQKDLLSIVFSLLMAVVPVFLVMCAFRYGMLEEFGKKSFLSELTTHLPLLIIWMSVPSIGLDRLEGKMIGGFMCHIAFVVIRSITSDLWWSVRAFLVYFWIFLRAVMFRREVQTYLDLGKSREVRNHIETSMINAIQKNRANPGTEMDKIRFPNAMYTLVQQVFEVCIQLIVPPVVVGCVFTGLLCLKDQGVYNWVLYMIRPLGLPWHHFESYKSRLMEMCMSIVNRAFPNLNLDSIRLVDSDMIGNLLAFMFFYIICSYYFIQCMGQLYWRSRKTKE